jgi:lysophospholipase L1-like esterase
MRSGTAARRWRTAALYLSMVSVVAAGVVAGVTTASAGQASYVALGDSYSSGVGTRVYYTDSGGCRRSPYAYPVLAAQKIDAELTFVACSGAKIPDVTRHQLGHLDAGTDHVSISIGGNDAGFSKIVTQCAKPWPFTCWGDINKAEAFARDGLPGMLDQLYARIRAAAPNARVVVVGYPRLFNETNCQSLARISPGEQARLNDSADLLNTMTRARATAHGFTFVDPRKAFTSHAVCDDAQWINGISQPATESYHPTRTGQVNGYAVLVTAALNRPASP